MIAAGVAVLGVWLTQRRSFAREDKHRDRDRRIDAYVDLLTAIEAWRDCMTEVHRMRSNDLDPARLREVYGLMTEAAAATTPARILVPLEVGRASGIAMTAGRRSSRFSSPTRATPTSTRSSRGSSPSTPAPLELIHAMQTHLGVEGEPPPPAPLRPSQ